jgi:CRISPR system Cascade subunit CasB
MPDPERGHRGDRAALARLRRAATALEAAEEEVTIALVRRLGGSANMLEPVAVCAAVLAHVRDNDGVPLARRIGPNAQEPDKRPIVSPLRFRRVIQAESAEDKLIQFRRLVRLVGGVAKVDDLAAALLDWSEPRKRDWIFRYYAGTPPDQDANQSIQQQSPEGTAS